MEESLFRTRYRVYTAVNEPVPHRIPTKLVYARRWYVAGVFALFGLTQGLVADTWWALARVTHLLYGWTTTLRVALVLTTGVVFLLTCALAWRVMLRFRRRCGILTAALWLTAVTGIRCIPTRPAGATIMAFLCAIASGFSGTLAFMVPPALSASWFPRQQRSLATAIMTLASTNLALATAFVVPETILPELRFNETWNTSTLRHQLTNHVDRMLVVEFLFCLVVFICVAAHFPEKPPLPPSSVATLPRISDQKSVVEALKSGRFWLVLVARALPLTCHSVLLQTLQAHAGRGLEWLVVYASVAGLAGGLLCAAVADALPRRTKPILVLLLTGAALFHLLAQLVEDNVLPGSPDQEKAMFNAFIIVAAFFTSGTIPLFAEFICELTYPVSELVVNGLQGMGFTLVSTIIAVVGLKVALELKTVLLMQTVACCVAVPVLLGVAAEYRRTSIDIEDETNLDNQNSAT